MRSDWVKVSVTISKNLPLEYLGKASVSFLKNNKKNILICDIIKNYICEIKGFVGILWKNIIQKVYFPNTSILGQIVSETFAQLREVQNNGKSLTVRPKKWSQLLTGGGRLLEVPTVRLWLGNFWCLGLAVAYGRWSLMRGGRTWRFGCTTIIIGFSFHIIWSIVQIEGVSSAA